MECFTAKFSHTKGQNLAEKYQFCLIYLLINLNYKLIIGDRFRFIIASNHSVVIIFKSRDKI